MSKDESGGAGADPFEGSYDPRAMERALRQRIDQLTREHAEERAEWNHQRSAYIRDVTMMAEAAGVNFDAPEAMADDIGQKMRDYEQTIRALKSQCEAKY